jgi:chromosome segregation ATPase
MYKNLLKQKNNIMKRVLSIWLVSLFLFSGCVVSKKKYEAMVGERDFLKNELNVTIKENKSLQNDIKKAIADFEKMKYELHQSNALKSDRVAELFASSEDLKKETKALKKELEETRRRFQNQQNTSIERVNELEILRSKVAKLTGDTASLQYSLRMSKERNSKIQEELREVKERYNQTAASNAETKNEMEKMSRKINMLEGQLVEKSQSLSKISDAFIELRKQLLSAKTNGAPIDPNKNKLVDKIARLLGHY